MTPTRGEIVSVCEAFDAEMAAIIESLDKPTRHALGLGVMRRCGAVAAWASGVDVLRFNRVVGLGVESPADPATLDALIEPFVAAGARRLMVQVCPAATPDALRAWLEERGFFHLNNWGKLWRDVAPIETRASGVRVALVGRERADDFARILSVGFGLPEATRPLSAAAIGRPGWRHYLGFEGETPIATGALLVRGDVGWLGKNATLAEHRGRGAQSAIIARRVEDAARLGCRFVVIETNEDTETRPAPSFRNATRLGFQVAYLRPNFVKVLRAE